MEVKKMGVVGFGQMGSGIAQVAAMAGLPTLVHEVSQAVLNYGMGKVEDSLARLVKKGTLQSIQKDSIRARIRRTTKLKDFADCDLVIEAITENIDEKKVLFRQLDEVVKTEAIFASNTSSLCITDMMSVTGRAPRFIGLHFFHPVPVMKLIEIVKTIVTDPAVVDWAVNFAGRLGKTPIVTSDRAGFIVNRLLIPFLMDAVRALEEGFGSVEEIDKAMHLGLGHPMGPLTLLDFVGMDTSYYIANILYEEYREARFAPPPLLRRMVLAGYLGQKSGKGFYDYTNPSSPKPAKFS